MTTNKVLLVEDNSLFISIVEAFFAEQNKYKLESVTNGQEAYDYLKCRKNDLPSLVISDIFMPKINGFELCSIIKNEFKNLPCIMITAHNDEENINKAFQVGADDYIAKPCSKAEFMARITKVLNSYTALISKESNQDKVSREITNIFEKFSYHKKLLSNMVFPPLNEWHWKIDIQGNFTFSSNSIYKLTGYSATEIIGKNFTSLVDNDSKMIADEILQELKERKSVINYETWNICKTDKRICLSTNLSTVHDKQTNKVEFYGISTDITKLKLIETENKTLTEIINRSPYIIIETSSKGEIQLINEAGCKYTGIGKDYKNFNFISDLVNDKTDSKERIISNILKNKKWQGIIYLKNKITNKIYKMQLYAFSMNINKCSPNSNTIIFTGKPGTDKTIDLDNLYKRNMKLKKLLLYDSLSGAMNKDPFIKYLDKYIKRSDEDNSKFALLFIDFDNFKGVNDKYGHYVGDIVLKKISSKLINIIRKSDVIGRIGGDEFVICIGNIQSKENVVKVLEKINEVLKEGINFEDKVFYISASIGITVFPYDGNTKEELLEKSDIAMYKAKRNRIGNKYHFFNDNYEF